MSPRPNDATRHMPTPSSGASFASKTGAQLQRNATPELAVEADIVRAGRKAETSRKRTWVVAAYQPTLSVWIKIRVSAYHGQQQYCSAAHRLSESCLELYSHVFLRDMGFD
ncbi:hypothetical protein BRAO285_880029 [Bradyrhizobium sp. ORS 285]|nr:hypothetical protein BRAO285_880029 [Bradyrhizobium sp. ORS 285]